MMAGDTDAESSAKGLLVNIVRRFLDASIFAVTVAVASDRQSIIRINKNSIAPR